jgi:TIR domain/NB-ARC domain
VADIFVSYTSSDRDWAFWIGQELESLGHTPHIHEWEISAGGDIMAWMANRLSAADRVLLVLSTAYLTKDYSSWERQVAQWAAASRRPNFVLPVFVEDCSVPSLLAPLKRCNLYGLRDEEARARLAKYLTPTEKPVGRVHFPGQGDAAQLIPPPAVPFPGDRSARQPRNLPFTSLGPLFIGRDKALHDLREALAAGDGAGAVGAALHGPGGVGKTQLAIEYALRHEADYSALLFVRADDSATLNASLAALAAADVLDLEEKEAAEDATKINAALRWLDAHPTWLLILDNVDDEKAVTATDKLIARLKGGKVIVTSRASRCPAHLRTLELGAIAAEQAAQFLLERTHASRAAARDDTAQAHALAHELGGHALALQLAGAYISDRRVSFERYRALLREKPEEIEKREERNRCYVSYAWADESDPKREEKVDALCESAKKRGVEIIRDKTALVAGDLISEFMRRMGKGDRVFIFLSDKYLHSPYCMFELFEMWRNNRQNKVDFLRGVRFFTVDGSKIGEPREWLKYTKFWKQERDELGQLIDDVGWRLVGEEVIKRYKLMETFAGNVSEVLALFADVVNPPTFETFLKCGFDDPPEGAQRH